MGRAGWALAGMSVALLACSEPPPLAVGQLLSERIELVAEAAEPLVSLSVSEGQQLHAGQEVLRLDERRQAARVRAAEAALLALDALLDEQEAGPRAEQIDAARAALALARVEVEQSERDWRRVEELAAGDLASRGSLESARARLDTGLASRDLADARLRELLAGTRPQQLEQTRQQIAQARARLQLEQLELERLTGIAPVAAVVDALPFEPGERPRAGDVLAVLLIGEQPLARVYVPEALRAGLAPGDRALLHIDGLAEPLEGELLRIASEAAFTPYFALTERDRGRLSWLAEFTLPDGLPRRLPDGLPVQAQLLPGADER